jgi:glycerol-3-phosphate O-acyltransferase
MRRPAGVPGTQHGGPARRPATLRAGGGMVPWTIAMPQPPDAITRAPAPPQGSIGRAGAAIVRRADTGYEPVVYRPSKLWTWLYDRFFRHIQVDEKWKRTVREAAQRGLVVYVGRSLSFLDFLALDYLTKKHDLPRIQFCNDLGMSIVEPFGRGSRRMRLRRQIPEDEALAATIQRGHSALLFLRRPPALASAARHGHAMDVDLIRTLVEMQRRIDKPIVLVPQTFVWTKRPASTRRTWIDLLFGPAEWPGRIRVLLQFLFNYKNALLLSGEPFVVGTFLDEHQDLTDAQAADGIRYALLRRMERERALVLGPAKKTAGRIVEELLRSPRVRAHLEHAARETQRPVADIERDARRELNHLCAAMDTTAIELFHRFLDRVWNRIYDGLVVDMAGLERLREAARRGPLVLLPSHKSHVDYLILSDVLYTHGLAPPLIAAGDNLSFWPLGPVLRRAGAFFIKRSFKGKKLYAQLVNAYIRKILVEGWNVEVFIEGGRSRTGKLLPPKLGILSMIVDAALQLKDKEIQFVPISIGYERIIEERSYVHELAGGEKKPESIGGLLGAGRVLRSKYGRLYLQFGEVLPFRSIVEEALALAGRNDAAHDGEPSPPAAAAGALSPAQRRALVQRIAHRVAYEVNRATIVTPAALTATALMAHKRRGITHGQFIRRSQSLLEALQRFGAKIAPPILDHEGRFRPETLSETIRLFTDAKLLTIVDDGRGDDKKSEPSDEPIYAVPEERRMALEYHKNTILHFFVPSALIASALLAQGGEVPLESLRERVRRLSRLFKLEFMYRADADFDEIFGDALESMREAGEVEQQLGNGAVLIRRGGGAAGARVPVYAEMLRTYFEAYRIALLSVRSLREAGAPALGRKEWLKAAIALGKRRWLSGQVTLRESVSRFKLENALSAWHDQQIVRIEGDQIRSGPRGAEAWDEMDRMLVEHLMID